jgi:hypothetical protein
MFHPLSQAAEMNNKGAASLQSGSLTLAAQYFRRALVSTRDNPPNHQNGESENQSHHNNMSSSKSTERVIFNAGLIQERMDASAGVYADPFFFVRAEGTNHSSQSDGFFCQDALLDYNLFSAVITFNTAIAHHRLAMMGIGPKQNYDVKATALYQMSIRLLSLLEDEDSTHHHTLLASGIEGATCDLIIMASLNNLEKLDPSNSDYTKQLVQRAVQQVDYGDDAISEFMTTWKGIFLFSSISVASKFCLNAYAPAA